MATKRVTLLLAVILCGGSLCLAQTQIEITMRSDEVAQKADVILNAVYKHVMEKLEAPQKELLRDAQRAWITYRDLCVRSEAASYGGGSIQASIAATTSAELTNAQSFFLLSLLPDVAKKTEEHLAGKTAAGESEKLQVAADAMDRVYQAAMKENEDQSIAEAQRAWVAFRTKAVAAAGAQHPENAEVAQWGYAVTLTEERTARLKTLFVEGYDEFAHRDEAATP